MKKPNLMILGASGGVANALLQILDNHRELFKDIILVDRSKEVLSNPYINRKSLNYIFVHKKIELPEKEKQYHELLKEYKVDILLDITDADSLPIFYATDRAGVSYVNTGLNETVRFTEELVLEVWNKRKNLNHAPHILCSGMNPGAVNMWARYGIEKFGVPKDLILFEYDTAKISTKWQLAVTWSIKQFLEEVTSDPSAEMNGRNKVKEFYPNALKHRAGMKSILLPIMKLKEYPEGFVVSHEETTSLAQKYDIPTKYIYALNIKTMNSLIEIYNKNKVVKHKDVMLADNVHSIIDGSDSIGMLLEYPKKRVYYFNSIPNVSIIGTNATYTQVIYGVLSALMTLIYDKLKPGTYFVEDLYDTHYKNFLFNNTRVQEFVFSKKGKKLKLIHYNPEVRIKSGYKYHMMLD